MRADITLIRKNASKKKWKLGRFALCGLVSCLAAIPCGAQTVQTPQTPQPAAPTVPAFPAASMLTLQQAEQMALRNHPLIQVATNLAAAAAAQKKEAQSAYYPNTYASATGAEADANSRIAAGALNNPIIYNRFAGGVTVTQLVTDFGRTHEMVKSADLRAQAEQQNVVTSRADVLLQADQAYFGALRAQAVLQVAQETVKNRQLVADQVSALAQDQLKSTLDVSFAKVDLAQAQLLLIQAQNDLAASYAQLSAALGFAQLQTFMLMDTPLPAAPSGNVDDLIQQALQNRPELIGQRLSATSAHSYATAERDLYFPTISAAGAAGLVPYRQNTLADRYAAAGFNVNIPIFNGHLFGSLKSEASARAQAQDQQVRDLQDRVARDVRTAWLNANSGFQRVAVTQQLLDQATQSLNLAQSRYNLGLSSIVELSQAQLNVTQAQIAQAAAKYDYDGQISALNFQIGALR